MSEDYRLTFISQEDFETHVLNTINSYNESLRGIDLKTFNSNVIDPIKLLFDKEVFRISFEEAINTELQRQRDKHNTNAIGYFHQNIFKYIENCTVPKQGWDVIFHAPDHDIFVEMKNKHNTMNSSSSQKTYMRMMAEVLENEKCECYLVEALAPKSRNIVWSCSLDGKNFQIPQIRRVSMDQFYKQVTGINDAFFRLCWQLPVTIDKLIQSESAMLLEKDTVLEELHNINPDTLTALYLLAFKTYEGFESL